MSASKRWVVTASGSRQLGEVAKELADNGFTVEEVFGEIGSVTGSASAEVAKKARAIPGVADISAEPSVDIGPPDAPVTW